MSNCVPHEIAPTFAQYSGVVLTGIVDEACDVPVDMTSGVAVVVCHVNVVITLTVVVSEVRVDTGGLEIVVSDGIGNNGRVDTSSAPVHCRIFSNGFLHWAFRNRHLNMIRRTL